MQNGYIEPIKEYSRRYVESFKRDLGFVRKVFNENPEEVKFYSNFCVIDGQCYNGIRKYMMNK